MSDSNLTRMGDSTHSASQRRVWGIASTVLVFSTVFCLFLLLISVVVFMEQQDIIRVSTMTRTETVPFLLEQQRVVRNLEKLYHYGELVVSAADRETRSNALFLATMLAAHQSLRSEPVIAGVVEQAKQAIERASALLDQELSSKAGDNAKKQDLALLTRREQAKEVWLAKSAQLIELADSLTVAGTEVAIQKAEQAADAASRAGVWLLGGLFTMLLLTVFAVLIVRRYLVTPFIYIARAVDFVKTKHQIPYLPKSRLWEIARSYEATTQLAHVILSEEAARQRFEKLAKTDELSSLPNRRYFFENAEAEWNLAHIGQTQTRPLSILMIDLDHFKRINDRYGHGIGDKVIQVFCNRLVALLRQGDLPGRLGGEEFAVLLPNTSMEQAAQVAERFRAAVADAPFAVEDSEGIAVSISIGVATVRQEDESIDNTIRRADIALYVAKNQGRNRVVVEEVPAA